MLTYYITDRKQFTGGEQEQRQRLLGAITAAGRAGVDFIQLREKDLAIRDLEALARQAMDALHGSRSKLLVNSRIDVAVATGAHGVHLPATTGELPANEARAILHSAGRHAVIVASSCHTMDEIQRAEAYGSDLAVFGPVFEKSGTAVQNGLAELRHVCARPVAASSRMPILAVGGVTLLNAASCLQAGADGIAAIRLFQQSPAETERAVDALRGSQPDGSNIGTRHPYR